MSILINGVVKCEYFDCDEEVNAWFEVGMDKEKRISLAIQSNNQTRDWVIEPSYAELKIINNYACLCPKHRKGVYGY